MLIMTAGAYQYTAVSYTCDGDAPTLEERADLAQMHAKLTRDGWERAWTDDTGKGVLVIYRRAAGRP